MKNFIKELLLMFFYFSMFSIIFGTSYILLNQIRYEHFPAPNLSNSISFNEKIRLLKKKKMNSIDILSLGSSMTLRNLSSEAIIEKFNNDSYFNLSSWGINMEENFELLKIFYDIYHPDKLIIASNLVDFGKSDKKFKHSSIVDYIITHNIFSTYFHISTFSSNYYLENIKFLKYSKSNLNTYGSLNFDEYGAAMFNKENFKITDTRWNLNIINTEIDQIQYSYLDSISEFCELKNIDFMFFQCPIREGMYSELDSLDLYVIKSHIQHVENILIKNNNSFVNTLNRFWNDSLFVDSIHFSNEGAKLFTDYCLNNIDAN